MQFKHIYLEVNSIAFSGTSKQVCIGLQPQQANSLIQVFFAPLTQSSVLFNECLSEINVPTFDLL